MKQITIVLTKRKLIYFERCLHMYLLGEAVMIVNFPIPTFPGHSPKQSNSQTEKTDNNTDIHTDRQTEKPCGGHDERKSLIQKTDIYPD